MASRKRGTMPRHGDAHACLPLRQGAWAGFRPARVGRRVQGRTVVSKNGKKGDVLQRAAVEHSLEGGLEPKRVGVAGDSLRP